MKLTASSSTLGLGILLLAVSPSYADSINYTFEGPGVQISGAPGALTETFDAANLSTPFHSSQIGGNYTGGTISQDIWGGAGNPHSPYFGVRADTTATLDLDSPANYFGLLWQSIDQFTSVSFYDGSNLLGQFGFSIFASLGDAYLAPGNPNGEKEVYVNFFPTGGSSITKVVFTQGIGGVFESDNHAITRASAQVPEATSSLVLLGLALSSMAALRRTLKN